MGLNKPSGQMYPGFYTWNPITGCEYNCKYCYLHNKRLNLNMTPRLVEQRFKDNLSKYGPISIFVGSSGDGWAGHIPTEWISRTLEYCKRFSDNTYLFQTKNPARFIPFANEFPPHTILTTTIETDSIKYDLSKAPLPQIRKIAFKAVSLRSERQYRTMVSVEPILAHTERFGAFLLDIGADIYSIGADSKRSGLEEPVAYAIGELVRQLEDGGKEVRLKANLRRIYDGELRLAI